MGKRRFHILYLSMLLTTALGGSPAFAAAAPAVAGGAPCASPSDFPKLKEVECSAHKEDIDKCNTCKQAVKDQDKKNGKTFRDNATACGTKQASCATTVASQNSGDKQDALMAMEGKATSTAKACYMDLKSKMDSASAAAKDCVDSLKEKCDGIEESKDAQKQCQSAKDKADAASTAAQSKADGTGDTAKKNDDNSKGQGSMPQIPQIPQQPQSQDPTPSAISPANTASAATGSGNGSSSPSGPSSSPLGTSLAGGGVHMDNSPLGKDVGANSKIALGDSSGSNGGGSSSGPAPASLPNGNGASGAGTNAAAPTGAGAGSGAGGGLGSGGSSSAASGTAQNTATGTSSSTDGGSEWNLAGGGKLGSAKGFHSGADADAMIADAAKDAFKADFSNNATDTATQKDAKTADADEGQTLFVQVKNRYFELKRRGNI